MSGAGAAFGPVWYRYLAKQGSGCPEDPNRAGTPKREAYRTNPDKTLAHP